MVILIIYILAIQTVYVFYWNYGSFVDLFDGLKFFEQCPGTLYMGESLHSLTAIN
jgi:hypothetical protein